MALFVTTDLSCNSMNDTPRNSKFIDVSIPLSSATPIWPTDPPVQIRQKRTQLSSGGIATGSRLEISAHFGTHIDAPLHYACSGLSIDQLPLETLVGPCRVYEHHGDQHITKNDLDAMGFMPGRRVLFKTRNSLDLRAGRMDASFLSLLPDAVDHLIASNVEVLGIDGLSIGPFGEVTDTVHVAFCGAGGIILEMLDLSEVEPGDYHMIALPLKLVGVEASPVRVVLVRPEDAGEVLREDQEDEFEET